MCCTTRCDASRLHGRPLPAPTWTARGSAAPGSSTSTPTAARWSCRRTSPSRPPAGSAGTATLIASISGTRRVRGCCGGSFAAEGVRVFQRAGLVGRRVEDDLHPRLRELFEVVSFHALVLDRQ